MPLEPGTKLGPYEIVDAIGAGGMGEVYRARDARLSREVAVKVLPASLVGDADRLRRFELEARAIGQLNHPNIVVVYDTGTHGGAPYVVEELLDGETLREKMGGSRLPVRKLIEYARQIAEGLAAAHHKGIVHRDLKPENVFVTSDGRVKLLDFGLAKLVRPETSLHTGAPTETRTEAGLVLGTIGYMSPEQVRGRPADHRSDLFSFGVILYEMVAGRRPFQAGSSVETLGAILKEEPPALSRVCAEIPADLERIVQHCMEKSPDERFQSASDLAFQLGALAAAPSAPVAELQSSRTTALRPRARLGLALALGTLAIAVAFVAGRRTNPRIDPATYSQLTFRQGSVFSARFTPDGETVVYSAAWDGSPTELFSTRPGSPESRPLGMQAAEVLAVSAGGEMAVLLDPYFTLGFMRSGTLGRVPLAGGVPRQVLENVQDADWSPQGDGLAVVRSVAGRYRLEYPVGQVLYETATWISSPRFSRDGARIGFLDHPGLGDNRGIVAVVDLSGKLTRLTEAYSSTGGLAWSPAGDEIWYTAGRTGNVQALHAVDLKGNQRVVDGAPANLALQDLSRTGKVLLTRDIWRRGMNALAPGATEERDLSWHDWSRPSALSADGAWLLFEEQGQGGGPGYSVFLRGTDGSPAVRLGDGTSIDLSPDGQWVLTKPVDQDDRLVLVPRGPGEARTLQLPGFSITDGGWFPDGRRLLILAHEPSRLRRCYVLDAAEGIPTPITPEGMAFGLAISPDGQRVAAAPGGGPPAIYSVEGGEPRPIPHAETGDIPVGWSADGQAVFLTRPAELPARIDRIDLDSGERSPFRQLMPADRAGLIDIGFVRVAADGRAYAYSYRRLLSALYLVEGLE